tara:strand:+ start:51 stop:1364 length:1314 start_codon:yes stop_codon:yes gene_type:complete
MSLKFKKIILIFTLLFLYLKPSFAEVTFEEILENPADLEINLKYATEQEALGRYKATLSTLERLNMLYPVNTDIKLYLISILLKMDSEAKLQLMIETMLQDPNTTKETRDYIEGILKTIRDQSKPKPKSFAYLDMSFTQNENSNIDGVSKSGNLYAQNNISEFPGIKYDKTYSRGGSITVGKNLDATSAISFNGSLSINTQNKGDENENDLTSGSISYSKILGKHYLLPYVFYSRPNERSSADLNTKGIGFNNTYNINKNNSISYSSSFTTTAYDKVAANDATNPDDANNDVYSASLGYNFTFADINLISSKISYTEKNAKKNYNAYTGPGINLSYTRIFPFGTFKIDKTYQTNTYDKKNTFIHTTINREDDIETSQIQLSGRLIQLIPFIKKLDPEGKIFYNFKHTEIDSESTLLNNSAIRKNTSFNIIKRFSLYE